MKLLVYHIGILAGLDSHGSLRLQGTEMNLFESVPNAWLYVEDGKYVSYGNMADLPAVHYDKVVFVSVVLPAPISPTNSIVSPPASRAPIRSPSTISSSAVCTTTSCVMCLV